MDNISKYNIVNVLEHFLRGREQAARESLRAMPVSDKCREALVDEVVGIVQDAIGCQMPTVLENAKAAIELYSNEMKERHK